MSKKPTKIAAMTDDEFSEMTGGIIGLVKHFSIEGDKLGLSLRQAGIFCRNTPRGKKGLELWSEFVRRRGAWGGHANYDFADFIREVLAAAGCPLKSPRSSVALRITLKNKKRSKGHVRLA